jgi:hypothetical protein
MTTIVPNEAYTAEYEYPNWNHKWGGGLFDGIFCQQNKAFYPTFQKLFAQENITRIVEIGTASGGFIHSIRSLTDVPIITYDIVETRHKSRLESKNIEVRVMDAFEDLDRIAEYIGQEGQTLVLCDGGNKPLEFNTLSRVLKSGDVIMAHDYVVDNDYYDAFIKENVWKWCEIKFKDIALAVDKYDLTPLLQEDFDLAVWCCFKKN